MVKRYLGERPSEYTVFGLLMIKEVVDPVSGSTSFEMICRMGDSMNPVNLLQFIEEAQLEKEFQLIQE